MNSKTSQTKIHTHSGCLAHHDNNIPVDFQEFPVHNLYSQGKLNYYKNLMQSCESSPNMELEVTGPITCPPNAVSMATYLVPIVTIATNSTASQNSHWQNSSRITGFPVEKIGSFPGYPEFPGVLDTVTLAFHLYLLQVESRTIAKCYTRPRDDHQSNTGCHHISCSCQWYLVVGQSEMAEDVD